MQVLYESVVLIKLMQTFHSYQKNIPSLALFAQRKVHTSLICPWSRVLIQADGVEYHF